MGNPTEQMFEGGGGVGQGHGVTTVLKGEDYHNIQQYQAVAHLAYLRM